MSHISMTMLGGPLHGRTHMLLEEALADTDDGRRVVEIPLFSSTKLDWSGGESGTVETGTCVYDLCKIGYHTFGLYRDPSKKWNKYHYEGVISLSVEYYDKDRNELLHEELLSKLATHDVMPESICTTVESIHEMLAYRITVSGIKQVDLESGEDEVQDSLQVP